MERLNDDLFSLVALKLNSDPVSIQAAVYRIMSGGVSSARFKVAGDRPGAQPAGVATYKESGVGQSGGAGILFHSHRDQRRWTVFLDGSKLPEVNAWREVQKAAESARFDEIAKMAAKIAREGEVRPYVGPGRDYFREKEMLDWSGVRYARKTYSWISGSGRRSKMLAHTPFWVGRNCETGAIQCVQGKYSRKGDWHVVTCGSTTGAQVQFGISDHTSQPMILCEGVSTAWGVFQVLGGRALVIATLGKGNLTRCAVAARAKIGDSRQLFVMADIDANGAGQSAANDAARESRSIAIAPLLVSQSAKSRATCLFEEGGKWDGWDLWRFVGKSQVGVDGLMRLSAIHDHLLSEGRRNG